MIYMDITKSALMNLLQKHHSMIEMRRLKNDFQEVLGYFVAKI